MKGLILPVIVLCVLVYVYTHYTSAGKQMAAENKRKSAEMPARNACLNGWRDCGNNVDLYLALSKVGTKEGGPYIRGRIIVVNQDSSTINYNFLEEGWMSATPLPVELCATGPEDVDTVVLLREHSVKVGKYSNGADAYRVDWDVTIIDKSIKKIVGNRTCAGGSPPHKIRRSSSSGSGAPEVKPVVDWIISLPRIPRAEPLPVTVTQPQPIASLPSTAAKSTKAVPEPAKIIEQPKPEVNLPASEPTVQKIAFQVVPASVKETEQQKPEDPPQSPVKDSVTLKIEGYQKRIEEAKASLEAVKAQCAQAKIIYGKASAQYTKANDDFQKRVNKAKEKNLAPPTDGYIVNNCKADMDSKEKACDTLNIQIEKLRSDIQTYNRFISKLKAKGVAESISSQEGKSP